MKSYLKFLSRNKLYTAIEAVGLVISIAFVILIGNYVWQQYSIAHENLIIYGYHPENMLHPKKKKLPQAIYRSDNNGLLYQ